MIAGILARRGARGNSLQWKWTPDRAQLAHDVHAGSGDLLHRRGAADLAGAFGCGGRAGAAEGSHVCREVLHQGGREATRGVERDVGFDQFDERLDDAARRA